jgi:hypothetical protein
MLCVGYHAHRCCFRSGRLCLAKACCLACWQGNPPDYDILVKCVLREANCVSCARVMARGAVSRLASVKGSCERLYRAPTRLFLSKRRAHPCALAFVFLSSRHAPPCRPPECQSSIGSANHETVQRQSQSWSSPDSSLRVLRTPAGGTAERACYFRLAARHPAFLQPNRSAQCAHGNRADYSALHKLLAAR